MYPLIQGFLWLIGNNELRGTINDVHRTRITATWTPSSTEAQPAFNHAFIWDTEKTGVHDENFTGILNLYGTLYRIDIYEHRERRNYAPNFWFVLTDILTEELATSVAKRT